MVLAVSRLDQELDMQLMQVASGADAGQANTAQRTKDLIYHPRQLQRAIPSRQTAAFLV